MTISLYDASVTNYLQIVTAAKGFMAKARAHFEAEGVSLDEVVETSLFHDMRPLRFQVMQVITHSVGAVQAMTTGRMEVVPAPPPAHDYARLQEMVAEAADKLAAVSPDEVNAREGQDLVFIARGTERVFTTEGFLTSFSLPNFYFHATTAYDILRMKGAPIGKLDFIGGLRLKG